MKKHSIEFLKTACLIRTKQFIDQEFERYVFMHRYQKRLKDMNKLNQVILKKFSEVFRSDSAILDHHPELKFAANFMKLKSEKFFEFELLAGFWGVTQYGSNFKTPIFNFFQIVLTQEFKYKAFQTLSFVRKHRKYKKLFKRVYPLRNIYDLAALNFRMQFDPLKFLVPLCLEFHTAFFRSPLQQESLIYYHALINFLTPLDTLRRDPNTVWAIPKNSLSQRVLKGETFDGTLIGIPEMKLNFQVVLDKELSFYDAMYFSLLDVQSILGRQLSHDDLEDIPIQLEQLSETIKFLSKKIADVKTRHPKEKSLTVSFQSLILHYFKTFKEAEFRTNRSTTLPKGFHQFLYDLLDVKVQKNCYEYKLSLYKENDVIKVIDVIYVADINKLSFSYDAIKNNLKNRKINVDLPLTLVQPNCENKPVVLADIAKNVGNFDFVER